MVSKKVLKGYDFETIYDYYYYIIESMVNGQSRQVWDLCHKLSFEQKLHFLKTIREIELDESIAKQIRVRV